MYSEPPAYPGGFVSLLLRCSFEPGPGSAGALVAGNLPLGSLVGLVGVAAGGHAGAFAKLALAAGT